MADMLPIKERLKIKRHEMPTLDPEKRGKTFEEVPTGYTVEDAISEAQRCLQCKVTTCMDGCPAQVRIPHFIEAIVAEDFKKALDELKITNALPACAEEFALRKLSARTRVFWKNRKDRLQ